MRYECSVCGFIYDEAKGAPEIGLAPGTLWEDLPQDWLCPLCATRKSDFKRLGEPVAAVEKKSLPTVEHHDDLRELTRLEMSALCTNLARGCEKQYKPAEAAMFTELAGYFKGTSAPATAPNFDKLSQLVEQDLTEIFPVAHATASDVKDRGALRALVWSEKVTRILSSILSRYQTEGDAMLENTGVYVCTICGFVYIGNTLPEVCPVCKVPNWKFEKIEGR